MAASSRPYVFLNRLYAFTARGGGLRGKGFFVRPPDHAVRTSDEDMLCSELHVGPTHLLMLSLFIWIGIIWTYWNMQNRTLPIVMRLGVHHSLVAPMMKMRNRTYAVIWRMCLNSGSSVLLWIDYCCNGYAVTQYRKYGIYRAVAVQEYVRGISSLSGDCVLYWLLENGHIEK